MQFFMMVHNENCVLWEKGKTSAVIKAATDFSQRMSRCEPISFSYGTLCQAQLEKVRKLVSREVLNISYLQNGKEVHLPSHQRQPFIYHQMQG